MNRGCGDGESLKRIYAKLEQGVVGLFMKTADPAFEIAGYAGFDFAILDLEHGPNSVYQIKI